MKKHEQLWQSEYQLQGIPSSYRETPTKAVTRFVSLLHGLGKYDGHAIDLGCGRGRNAFYLAEHGYHVIGLDLVEKNIQREPNVWQRISQASLKSELSKEVSL